MQTFSINPSNIMAHAHAPLMRNHTLELIEARII